MKALKALSLVSLLFILAACGSDSDDNIGSNPNGNNNNTGGNNGRTENTNSNLDNSDSYTHRMEFPRITSDNGIIITHTLSNGEVNYSLNYDTLKKSNRWTCYELYASNRRTGSGVSRYRSDSNQYPQDPSLESRYRWRTDPFRSSGYDHGHLCPSADRLNTQQANNQTFYLTNMMPQVHGFNAGVWEKMEEWVRNQISVSGTDTLFIVKGGTIDNSSQYSTLARTGGELVIPAYYYMALLMHNSDGYKAMGFWVEHAANNTSNLSPYVVNIDELEQLTGIDFFCNLPDDIETYVESRPADTVRRAWGF